MDSLLPSYCCSLSSEFLIVVRGATHADVNSWNVLMMSAPMLPRHVALSSKMKLAEICKSPVQ